MRQSCYRKVAISITDIEAIPLPDNFTGLTNTFGVRLLHYLNNVSVWWHAIGTFVLVIAILAKAPHHQSGHFVFKTFRDGTGLDGEGWATRASPAYVAIIGVRTDSPYSTHLSNALYHP